MTTVPRTAPVPSMALWYLLWIDLVAVFMKRMWVAILCLGVLVARHAIAQENGSVQSDPPEKEAAAILEVGAEPARSLSGGGWTLSPTVAVEVTPIENWLELEFGVTPTFSHHSTEWDTDFLFKKPWTLSKKVEFMFGGGPEWIHIRENGITTNSLAGEIALDFMFWPSPKRRFGWYIEPAYDYTFGRSHDQAISVSIGLLISVR